MSSPRENLQRQGDEAAASQSLQDLRFIAKLAHSLSVHLWECWPVQGQGQAVAGPPILSSLSDLYRHLVDLKTLLFRFRAPAGNREEFAWLQSRAPVLQAQEVAAALAQIDRVTECLADQFNARAALATVDGHHKTVLTPTLNAEQLWQSPTGWPPEIDPQDVRSLGWSAAKLFRALGEEPPGLPVGEWPPGTGGSEGQEAETKEEWRPASEAAAVANKQGFSITLDWISKRKDRIRSRPRELPGRHKTEVEMGSFAKVLLTEAITEAVKADSDELDRAERDEIEARKVSERKRKRRSPD
jgi:hypothetical protein